MNKILILCTPNCVKCKSMVPKIQEFLDEHQISYEIKHELNEFLDLAQLHNIQSVPTVIVYEKTPQDPEKIFSGDFELQEFYDYVLV